MAKDEERGTTSTLVDEQAANVDLDSSPTAGSKFTSPPTPAGLDLTPLADSELLVLTFTKIPIHPEDPLCRNLPSKFWTTLLAALLVMIVSPFLSLIIAKAD
jgi:hypothetical protein